MFRAKIDSKLLYRCVQAIRAVAEEARLDISPSGISVKAVDPSNTDMIDLQLTDPAFSEFEATELQLGVDIAKLLGYAEKLEEGTAELELDEKEYRLLLRCGGLSYKIAPLAPDTVRKPPKIPSLGDGYYDIELSGAQFKKCHDVASSVSVYVLFSIEKGVFSATGDGDTDSARYEVGDISAPDTKALFSEDFIADFVPVLKGLSVVRLSLCTDFPLRLFFSLGEGAEGMYMLAPRVKE